MSNKQTPVTPGRVLALANQFDNMALDPLQATLSLFDALPDPNCSLAPEPSSGSGSALVLRINRLQSQNVPSPLQTTLSMFNHLPNLSRAPPVANFRRGSTTFPFADFPIEIQALVWEHAVPRHRRHLIRSNEMKRDRKIPAILHVNHLSRATALKFLKPLFDGVNMIGSQHFKYFDPETDTVFFDYVDPRKFIFFVGPPHPHGPWALAQEPMEDCDNILRVTIRNPQVNIGPIVNFRNLERITILHTDSQLTNYDVSNPMGCRMFVDRMYFILMRDTRHIDSILRRRFDKGRISRVPQVIVLPSRADTRVLRSTGDYFESVFGKDMQLLKDAQARWVSM